MTTTEMTAPKVAPPPAGMGKWNRKKRMLTKTKVTSKGSKAKITKDERREKYTAIAKDRQIRSKSKNLVCYNCRETGHSVQHCPKSNDANSNSENTKKKKHASSIAAAAICYKCGSTEHALAACPKKRRTGDTCTAMDDLPFATCFVCQGKGHLASGCPNNANGIYVNGSGECKHCGSKQHRGTDCPDKKKKKRNENDEGRVEVQDFSDLLEGEQPASKPDPDASHKKAEKKKRVVNF